MTSTELPNGSPSVDATGVVLAAGAGRRFGQPKALVQFHGERLVDRAVRLLISGGCRRVVVVSGAAPLQVDGADVVHNPRWRTGMGSSLVTGLAAVRESAALVIPVDMPWLGAEAVRRLRFAGSTLAVATYHGRRGHPVLIGSQHFPEVSATAVGDIGAREYLATHAYLVRAVPCDDTGTAADVDTPQDLVDALGFARPEGGYPG
ncbi:nucleotidyltransferase family protein [Gordonia liuliyuniae]|uniref:Nucleotidyltransferase family protein n=1 Tax=Gordonia liuliyuniae TaxID=2911517 RepID=A0ABS9IY89_9ACTN|nr:nucleotidyltransferase family protein [Gordonia liuliyuniae]MCF8590540.1 nucleotidyltransferase family protein [Gordonia liuliyuniae]